MTVRSALTDLAKLLACGLAFSLGAVVGGIVATFLGLQPPQLPEGADAAVAIQNLMLTSPLMGLALALVARGLSGGFLQRSLALGLLTWIAYSVNTQVEAAIFTTVTGGFWFTVVDFLIPSLMVGAAAAWLFPSSGKNKAGAPGWRAFFGRRSVGDWVWRMALATVVFVPIYYFFGSLVIPFTADYYHQTLYGLQMPSPSQIVVVQLLRSALFLVACLPVLVAWRTSRLELFLSLGFALFVLVGLLYALASYWMPWELRLPHALEIMADSFAYAGALVLLVTRLATRRQEQGAVPAASIGAG
jgi:hypothetical protein